LLAAAHARQYGPNGLIPPNVPMSSGRPDTRRRTDAARQWHAACTAILAEGLPSGGAPADGRPDTGSDVRRQRHR